MRPPNDHPIKYRPDIDGLRAVAVLAVVFFHARIPGFQGGFIGVDVFFVISGFLITQLLVSELDKTGSVHLAEFYSRRLRRLYPAIFLVVVVTLALWAAFLLGNSYETENLIRSARYSLFGLANFYFERKSGGYFDGASDEMPLLHFWSLGVEEQFYLVYPWLFVGVASVCKNWDRRRRSRLFLYAIAVMGLASLAMSEFLILNGKSHRAFYSMPARVWELAVGAGLVFIQPNIESWGRWPSLRRPLAAIATVLLFFAISFYEPSFRFPGLLAALPVFATVVILLTRPSWLAFPPLVRIGLLSYGIYLWHWPLLAMLKVWQLGEVPSLAFRLGALLFSLMAAQFSLNFVENPLRFGRLKALRPSAVLVSFVLGGLLIVACATRLRGLEKRAFANTEAFMPWINERSVLKYCWEADIVQFPKGCASDGAGGRPPRAQVVVWGNSHTGPYLPLFEEYVRKNPLILYSYGQGNGHFGADYATDLIIDGDASLTETGKKRNEIVLAGIKELAVRGKVSVVLSSRWIAYGGDAIGFPNRGRYFLDSAKTKEGSIDVMIRSIEKTLNTLTELGVSRVLILLAYPEFKYPVLGCSVRNPARCNTLRAEYDAHHAKTLARIREVAGKHPNVRIFSALDLLCDPTVCPQTISLDGKTVPVVSDTDHPIAAVTRGLAKNIWPDLDWLTE